MLKGSLYTLDKIERPAEGSYVVNATLNRDHEIFGGHFPQQPILPGVCLLEMLGEIISQETKQSYQMAEAANIKYIIPIDPEINPVLKFEITTKPTEGGLLTSASTFLPTGEANFKFKGLFKYVE